VFPPYVLIRDDDISYFTQVEQFQKAHRLLLENDVPLNVAVVPMASDSVPDDDGGYEGFIPRELCGNGRFYPVRENRELITFLKTTQSIEVVQHGFSHERLEDGSAEFSRENMMEIVNRLDEGAQILMDIFSKRPSYFVPPYDSVSPAAMREIRKRYDGVCLSRIPHELLPIFLWPKFLWTKWRGHFLLSWNRFGVLQHPGIDFSMMRAPFPTGDSIEAVISGVRDVLVLTLHSWHFFTPEGQLKSSLLNQWETFLGGLISTNKTKFLKFSEIVKIVQHG